MRFGLFIGRYVACVLATMVVFAGASLADVVIVGSDSVKLPAGTTLTDAQTLDVPKGSTVRVLLPSGRTEVLKGPLRRAVKDLGKGEARDEGLFRQIIAMIKPPESASERPGATRSAVAPAAPLPAAFSWKELPVDAEGDYCVQRGADLSLMRGRTSAPLRVTIVDVEAGKRAEAEFKSGEAKAAWPQTLPPKVGTYALVQSNGPMRRVRLRLISPLPDKDHALRVLHGQRCLRQMQALVKLMANPAY